MPETTPGIIVPARASRDNVNFSQKNFEFALLMNKYP